MAQKITLRSLLTLALSVSFFCCVSRKGDPFTPKVVYESDDLIVTQISGHAFQHTSFLDTQTFGKVPCNGLVVENNRESIVFDTPTTDAGSAALIRWIEQTRQSKIVAVIPTHFHDDCLGGLAAFHKKHIPSYAHTKTIALARENNFAVPQHGFDELLTLKAGGEKITAKYFGAGHTQDNIVGYFPGKEVMFGGCLIKELDATPGYLGDANVAEWPKTVAKIKRAYPNVKVVVPGHGSSGDSKLLDYTIILFAAP